MVLKDIHVDEAVEDLVDDGVKGVPPPPDCFAALAVSVF